MQSAGGGGAGGKEGESGEAGGVDGGGGEGQEDQKWEKWQEKDTEASDLAFHKELEVCMCVNHSSLPQFTM